MKSLPRPGTDSDMWVPDHLTPSWVCLPNDQPVLTIIKPGESVLCVLETICKVCRVTVWPLPMLFMQLLNLRVREIMEREQKKRICYVC